MPKFDKQQQGTVPAPSAGGSSKAGPIPTIREPRCKVCQSPHRNAIDQLLAAGFTYSEIERQFAFAQIPRRSISGHSDNHLNYDEAAIREVIEREAKAAQRNFEDGKKRLITKNTYLEVALSKAYDALVKDLAIVEPKDAVKIIEMLQKLEQENQSVALDELRMQLQMFMQAVKELVEREKWEHIVHRTGDLLKASGRTADIDNNEPELVDAVVIDEPPAVALAKLEPHEGP